MTGVVAHKYTHPASKYLIPFRFFNSFDRMLEWPSDELIKKNRYGMHKALKLITAIIQQFGPIHSLYIILKMSPLIQGIASENNFKWKI